MILTLLIWILILQVVLMALLINHFIQMEKVFTELNKTLDEMNAEMAKLL